MRKTWGKTRKNRGKKTRKTHKRRSNRLRKGGRGVPMAPNQNPPNNQYYQNNAFQAAVNAANLNMNSGLTDEEWSQMSLLREYFLNNGPINDVQRQEIQTFMGARAYELSSEGDTNPSLEEGELPNIENEQVRAKINEFLVLLRKHNDQDLEQTKFQFGF